MKWELIANFLYEYYLEFTKYYFEFLNAEVSAFHKIKVRNRIHPLQTKQKRKFQWHSPFSQIQPYLHLFIW